MLRKKSGYSINAIFVLALVCLFAVCSLLIILFGGQVYKNIVRRTEANYDMRTGMSYVINKVRAADADGAFSVEDKNGTRALVITEHDGGEAYRTYIYFYDGALRESMLAASGGFNPAMGEAIVSARDFHVSLDSGLITLTLKGAAGREVTSAIRLRGSL